MSTPPSRQRLDQWLWHARFFKTRGIATRHVGAGHVRVNGHRTTKPAQQIAPGDVLTFVQARAVRVVRVAQLSSRRGPAAEARLLYLDLDATSQGEDGASGKGGI